MDKPRIKVPDSARAGEIIDIKTVITHPMETGNRRDAGGQSIPRKIIHTFSAAFAGKPVFRADFGPGISANPYISFSMRVPGPGAFLFTWIDDDGRVAVETTALNVVG